MAFSYFNRYSQSPPANSSPAPDGAPEGMPAGDVNDAIRQAMAALAESHDSYALLISNDPTSIDPLVPTALPASAWSFDYGGVAYLDVEQDWSTTQTFLQGIIAGEVADDGVGVEIKGNTFASLVFTSASQTATMALEEATGTLLINTNISVSDIAAAGDVTATGNVEGVNVSATGGGSDGVIGGRVVVGAEGVTASTGNVSAAAGDVVAADGNVTATGDSGDTKGILTARKIDIGGGDSTIAGNMKVSGELTNVNDDPYLNGGPVGNYPGETPVQFTNPTVVAFPADRGKMCQASGGTVGFSGTAAAGDRFDVFNASAGNTVVSGLSPISGNGVSGGIQVTIPAYLGGSFIRSSDNTFWIFVGTGEVS